MGLSNSIRVVAGPYHIVPATKAAKKDSSNTTGEDMVKMNKLFFSLFKKGDHLANITRFSKENMIMLPNKFEKHTTHAITVLKERHV